MQQFEGEDLLTPEQAAGILVVSRRTLDRYADNGRIIKYQTGTKNVYFKRSDVERLKSELSAVNPKE